MDDEDDEIHGSFVDHDGDGLMDDDDVVFVEVEEEEEDDDEELELLLVPHILDLPAFKARAAAPSPPAQQEAATHPFDLGGWLNLVSSGDVALSLTW
ncbi:hypothetical protein ACP70R_048051 [Stipagrostis hirtigluma subsp. patula]